MNHIATWACALSALAAGISTWRMVVFLRTLDKTQSIALRNVGDAYREGWEMLSAEIVRLNARVAELEQ